MASSVRAEVKGLKEVQRNLEQAVKDLHGGETLQAMRDSTLMVEASAKRNLVGYQGKMVGGVDSGRLRASITPEVNINGNIIMGVVGSNVKYAPFVEFDTKPHWVPKGVLAIWAKRHHVKESIVRWGISRHGTKGKHYLQRAFETNEEKIKARFEKAVAALTRKAND